MERASRTPDPDDRANALYWGSDRSVNQIAEELDLSKGAFYAMIRPLAAGLGCPQCGREVAHINRTCKGRGTVDCPACGWQGEEDETLPEYMLPGARPGRPSAKASAAETPRSRASTVWSPTPPHSARSRATVAPRATPLGGAAASIAADLADGWTPARTLAAGALLGGAVGLALVLWARRR